jgi:hypothetical protein
MGIRIPPTTTGHTSCPPELWIHTADAPQVSGRFVWRGHWLDVDHLIHPITSCRPCPGPDCPGCCRMEDASPACVSRIDNTLQKCNNIKALHPKAPRVPGWAQISWRTKAQGPERAHLEISDFQSFPVPVSTGCRVSNNGCRGPATEGDGV